MRGKRGKAWNWYKRCVKRDDWRGPLWLTFRIEKRLMVEELGAQLYSMGDHRDFDGLHELVDGSTAVVEMIE